MKHDWLGWNPKWSIKT